MNGSLRLATITIVLAVLVAISGSGLPATLRAQSVAGPDLAAMVLSPLDEELNGFTLTGAFDESLSGEASVAASYRGNPDSEAGYLALLQSSGFLRKHVSTLQHSSPTRPDLVQEVVRSYITHFATPEGATTAFTELEDEREVPGAEDQTPPFQIGEQIDLTADGAYDAENRPFRSLDLTFRTGPLIGGVTLIVYPSEAGSMPDVDRLMDLGELLLAKIETSPVGVGSSVARLDPDQTVTYDDAYYRADGQDVPLTDESAASSQLRTAGYGDAQSVYQLFQGVAGENGSSILYSLTLYEFLSLEDAAQWLDESAELIGANQYYGNLTEIDVGEAHGDVSRGFSFVPPGAAAKAGILLTQSSEIVIRVQIVPAGASLDVPMTLLDDLTQAQLECLSGSSCTMIEVPASLMAFVEALEATPAPAPAASPAASLPD